MSFLRDYKLYTSGNEADPIYHYWCALVALSSLISRRVYIEQGYFKIYANLYVVLVGPPAARKTTAMQVCKDLLYTVGGVPFSAECQTKESLIKEWSAYAATCTFPPDETPVVYTPITICVTELSNFISVNPVAMLDFLTTIYDEKRYVVKTKNKGNDTIEGPYVCLLGCTTPDWITARLKEDIISGGLSRRVVFVYSNEDTQRIPFPEVTSEQRLAWGRVLTRAEEIKKLSGRFEWAPDAKAFYADWYTSLKIPSDPVVQGYFKSKHVMLQKIAMLIALSEENDLVLRKNFLELGLELLGQTEQHLTKIFQGIGRNELYAIGQKVITLISQAGGCLAEKQLYVVLSRDASAQETYEILKQLIQSEQIVMAEIQLTGDQIKRKYVMLPTRWKELNK